MTDEEKKLINPCDAKTAYEATIQTLKMVKCEVEKIRLRYHDSSYGLYSYHEEIIKLLNEMIGEVHG